MPVRLSLSATILALLVSIAGCKSSQAADDKSAKAQEAASSTATSASANAVPTASADAIATAAPSDAPAASGAVGAARKAGDRVNVRWKGRCYPARILKVAKPGTYFITYEGYSHSWDETVGDNRICG